MKINVYNISPLLESYHLEKSHEINISTKESRSMKKSIRSVSKHTKGNLEWVHVKHEGKEYPTLLLKSDQSITIVTGPLRLKKAKIEKDLEYWKAKILDILSLQKSLGDILYPGILIKSVEIEEMLLKAKGFAPGTIREWKGKKYKKLSSGKWMRTYSGTGDRGEKQAIGNVRRKIASASSMKELLDIVRDNRERFMDGSGRTMPVIKEFLDAARSTESGKKKKPISSGINMTGTEKQVKYAKDLIDKVITVIKEKDSFITDYDKYKLRKDKKLAEGSIDLKEYNEAVGAYQEDKKIQDAEIATRKDVISDLENLKLNGKAGLVIDNLGTILNIRGVYGHIISRKDERNKHSKWDSFVESALNTNSKKMDTPNLNAVDKDLDTEKDVWEELPSEGVRVVEEESEATPVFEITETKSNNEMDASGYIKNGDLDGLIKKANEDDKFKKAVEKILDENRDTLPKETIAYIEDGLKNTRGKDKKKRKSPVKESAIGDIEDNVEYGDYSDTGYIAGSQKEKIQAFIKRMMDSGKNVGVDDIDWEQLEENPREAQALIKKSNIIGKVDWDSLKEKGMEPGAGFLIDRVYASIASNPEDDVLSRKDYVNGIESLRNRLEGLKTVQEVRNALNEFGREYRSVSMNAEDTEKYNSLQKEWVALREGFRLTTRTAEDLYREVETVENQIRGYNRRADSDYIKNNPVRAEENKKEIEMRLSKLAIKKTIFENYVSSQKGMNVEYDEEGSAIITTPESIKADRLVHEFSDFKKEAMVRAWLSNDAARAWLSLGSRYINIIGWRSNAFRTNVGNVRRGKYDTWEWTDKSKSGGGTSRSKKFKLVVSDSFERIGGRQTNIKSTAELKDSFNLRDIQSGTYVLSDKESAKFHVEQTAGALSDLSEITGIEEKKIGMNGRLALAFGARGKGGAKAHYEPVQRVINITKMGGGGSLAHEWFHAFDNLITETMGEGASGVRFQSDSPSTIENPEFRKTFEDLSNSMLTGTVRVNKMVAVTDKQRRLAEANLKDPSNVIAEGILEAGNLKDAVIFVQDKMASQYRKRNRDTWIKIATAHYTPKDKDKAVIPTTETSSQFYSDSVSMDGGNPGRYWSQPLEMAARAFAGWTEERLNKTGRKSDYLSNHSNNESYDDYSPYPSGEEKTKIYESFDKMFEVIKNNDLIQKALC